MIKVSLYNGSKDTVGFEADYTKILAGIQTGRWQKDIQNLRTLLKNEGVYRYSQSKIHLPAATFAGTFTARNAAAIKTHSKMIVLDIDGITETQINNYKDSFKDDKFIHACFVSPSNLGIKILIKLQCEPTHHLAAFLALKEYFKGNYALTIDDSGKDISRLCFISYDPDLYLNEGSEPFIFDLKEIKLGPTIAKFDERPEKFKGYVISKDAKYAFGVCEKWTQRHHQYEQGNRNNYLHVLSCNLNRAGVHIDDALLMIYNNHSDLPFKEIEQCVHSAYRRASEHNSIDIYNTEESNLPDHIEDLGLTNEQEIIFNDTLKLKKAGIDNNMIAKLIKNFGIAFFGMTEKEVGDVMNKAVTAFKKGSGEFKNESASESLLQAISEYQDTGGVSTGVLEFDDILNGGLMPSCLYGMVGVGGSFKSLLAHCIGADLAKNGGLTIYFNMEMSRLQLMDRVVNKELGIELTNGLKNKTITEANVPEIILQLKDVLKDNFQIVTGSGFTQDSIVDIVRNCESKLNKKVSLIIVDGLSQLEDSKKDEIKSAIFNSGELKEVAKKSNAAVIVLVHTSGGINKHTRNTANYIRGNQKVSNNMDAIFCTSLLIDENSSNMDEGDILYRQGIFYVRLIDKRGSGLVASKIIRVHRPLKLEPLDIDPQAMEISVK